MKVHFDNVNLISRSGPNTFASRLYHQLLMSGVEVIDAGPDADVSLVFIEPSGKPLAKKVVQRLDGIWFKPQEFEHKNVAIKRLYETADAVIWQSEFDHGMTNRWWGMPKTGRVIHNGIDLTTLVNTTEALQEVRNTYKHVFVCSSNWHAQKRLRSNIEMFFHLRDIGYQDSCLIVMGSNPDVFTPSPHVMYTGPLDHQTCLSVFNIADWMIHLAWLDHCPNVVIEALSQKVPVICSSAGGTKELVSKFGLILNETVEYGFELANYDAPPVFNVKQLTSLPNKNELGLPADISIVNAASKYIELFQAIQ